VTAVTFFAMCAIAAVSYRLWKVSRWGRERDAQQTADQEQAALRELDLSDWPNSAEFAARLGSAIAEEAGWAYVSPVVIGLARVARDLFDAEHFSADAVGPRPAASIASRAPSTSSR